MGKCVYRGLSIQIVGAYPLHKKGVSLTLPLNVHKVWFAARTGTRQESAMDLLRLQGGPANRDGRTAPLNGARNGTIQRPWRVLLIGASTLSSFGIARLCEKSRHFEVLNEAVHVPNGRNAPRFCPDVIVLDLMKRSTAESAEDFHSLEGAFSPIPILVLFDTEQKLDLLLPKGARCAIGINDTAEEWNAALSATVRGAWHLSSSVGSIVNAARSAVGNVAKDEILSLLSQREIEIARLTGAGLMPAQIASRLRRSVKTVEAHYHRMKTKLGLNSIAQLRERLNGLR